MYYNIFWMKSTGNLHNISEQPKTIEISKDFFILFIIHKQICTLIVCFDPHRIGFFPSNLLNEFLSRMRLSYWYWWCLWMCNRMPKWAFLVKQGPQTWCTSTFGLPTPICCHFTVSHIDHQSLIDTVQDTQYDDHEEYPRPRMNILKVMHFALVTVHMCIRCR